MVTNPLRAAWGYLRGDDLKALAPTTFPAAASRIVEEKIAFTTETYPGGVESVIRMGTLVHGPGATEAYARAYGMGDDANSAVFACLERICTTYVKAPLRVWRGDAEGGKPDVMVDHPLEELLATPNDAMTGAELWWWTQWAKEVAGNAYWRKVRAGNADTGNVVQLWPLSPALVVPVTTEEDRQRGVFLSHYRYQYAPGRYEAIAPQNLVHFKLGLADHDHRLGCSPLQRLVRQVATDDEATRFTQTLLTNYAVPGLVYFAGEKDGPLNQDKADALKARITALFSGEGRGRVGVASPGADMKQYGFSPQEMDLKVLHRLPEERIAAVLGVPPGVAGLGAGLDRQIYNNYREAREAFFEQKILPAYQFDGSRVDASLLPDFTTQKRVFCRFDTAQLPELAEDQDKKFARVTALLAAGGLTLNQAQLELGLPGFGSDGDVLYLPNKVAPTLPADLLAAPQPPPLPLLPPVNGANGANGQAQITEVPPGGKRLRLVHVAETKRRPASDVVRAALLRLKARLVPPCADDLAAYLRDERDQTAASVRVLGLAAGSTLFSRAGELRTLLAQHQRRALRSVQVVTEDALGVTLELDAAAAVRALGDVAHSVEAHTHDAIRQALAAGDAAGETAGPLAVRVAALPVFSEARAQEIARTELARAVNLAALRAYEAAGVPTVRIDDSSDDPACAAEAGRELPLGEAAAVPLVAHPNCLVGSSVVWAPNARASFARWYDGEVVILRTAADEFLTCTPNHPVLSDRGWVAADTLRQGDYVLHSLDSERIAGRLDPDHDYRPATIEQVARTLGPAGEGASTAVPCAAEYFHGDGAGSDVYVVRTNRLAERDRQTGRFQPTRQLPVQWADVEAALLTRLRPRAEVVQRARHAPDGLMGRGGIPLPSLGPKAGIPEPRGFARGASDAEFAQPAPHGAGSDAKLPADSGRSQALPDVQVAQHRISGTLARPTPAVAERLETPAQRRAANPDASGDVRRRLAGLIAPVQVVEVERRQFSGHVYNLETAQGWYVAEGIITHNCGRLFLPAGVAASAESAA